ncbi:contractile injection system protein, VgrG/Pvc8 family [Leptotrichia massiliensis]|uniref:contractile injection system protein, VgrG/Pvc8 family n=1 Tax=Leptotrichia massiliensis TaxID=1852388 RepID=UPI0028EB4601|nr:contractile injection system protein, VgrG/Pvc8 family [Leptotrichia massiliensis]
MNNNLNNQKPVEFFSAERIKIEIDGQQILWRDMSLEINSRIGEHTIGRIKYIGSVNQLSLYDALIDRKGDKEIKILGKSNIADNAGNSTEKIFLNGVIKELQINETTAGALTVEITAISKSVLLDRIPRYRSFQDPTLTYSAIAEEINGNYGTNDGKIVNVGEDIQIVPRMTIQYNETDWEYLKRLASYTGQPVMAYSDKVFVGFFKNMPAQTPNLKYSQFGKRTKEERTYFKITGTEVYPVATPIKLKTRNRVSGEEVENDYYVLENKIYNEGNTLKCEYILGKQTDYFVDPIPHEKIRGAVIEARTVHIARTDESKSKHGRSEGSSDNLEGRAIGVKPLNKYIEKTENNQNENTKEKVKTKDIAVMTLNLTEGLMDLGENGQSFEDKYAGKSYFPYVTPYSQTNTGFTPAPEVNDRVALYFPNGNETKAFIIGALNNDGNGRFTDVANRNYHVGDSDFNMVLATNSLSTSAASSISQTASSISESADSISENAGSISNSAKNYSETVEGVKSVLAQNITQTSTQNTTITSNNDTTITSSGTSKVAGGGKVLING